MPYNFDIYSREVLATKADYCTVAVLLSEDINAFDKNFIYVTASQTLESNKRYAYDTSYNPLIATLPSNPNIADEIEIFDIHGTWNTNSLTVNNNGKYIEGFKDSINCNVKYGYIKLIYCYGIGWRIIPLPKHNVAGVQVPSVTISANVLSGFAPLNVSFVGTSLLLSTVAPVDNWYWNLTGGNTPDYFTQNVTFVYPNTGVYTINLTGVNSAGIGTALTTITAITAIQYLAPVPVISATSLSGITPFTITLSGINTLPLEQSPVTNWYWNLTGGNTVQFTTQNVTYTYNTGGTYTVNLTASNSAGFGTTTQTVVASTATVPTSSDIYSDYVTLLLHFNN